MNSVLLVVMLAVQMILLAGLLHLLGRRRHGAGQGFQTWGNALVLFGSACVLRWLAGLHENSPLLIPGDTAMVAAVLLLVAGADAYLGRRSCWTPRLLLWATACFATTHLLLLILAGPAGRHVLLNLCLGALHGVLAWQAWQLRYLPAVKARPPAGLLLLGVGGLALLALLRAAGGGLALIQTPEPMLLAWLDALYVLLAAGLLMLWILLWLGWRRWALRCAVGR